MRKLLWFTLGFGTACAFCAYGRIPILAVLPVIVLLWAFLTGNRRTHKILLAAAGIAAGLVWFSRFEDRVLQPVYAMDGITEEVPIRCSGFPEETDYGSRVEGILLLGEREYQILCYLDEGEHVVPGDRITGPFRFRVTAPGGEKESSYHQGEGIFLIAYQQDLITVIPGQLTWREKAAVFRQKILRILETTLPEDASAFARALLLGDTSALDYETKTDFTVSGIRHIVAVSGLHVSILFSLVQFLSFRRRFLTGILALPVLALFAAVTGFTPSVSRACIMCGMMLLAMLLSREYDGPAALSCAGLVLLIVNPLVITSVSYQLSFVSVAGIFLFASPVRKWILSCMGEKAPGRLAGYLASSISVTLGATVLTVPLCAWYFGTVSLAAVVTNLLVLWVVSVIFYGLIVLCLLPGASVILAKILTVLIRYVLVTAKIIGAFPLSAVYMKSPYIVAWLVFVYLLLAVFLWGRNKKPVQLACCMSLGLCIALLASWTEPMTDDTRLTVLDVGQGQCLLIQWEGKICLVDCGGSSDNLAADTAAETLLSQGITALDAVILTHHDRDHAGGLGNLLTRIPAKLLILPPVYSEETFPAEKTLWAREDLVLDSGETKIRIFVPADAGNDNENSLCILFDTKNCDILVTGDRSGFGERSLLRRADLPDVDVLIAGHHGSQNSTCEELLTAVQPEIVCISAGRNNLFGHPAPELLERLDAFGCSVYRTDLHGTITIRR